MLHLAPHWKGRPLQIDEDFFYRDVPRAFVARFQGTHPQTMRERVAHFDQKLLLSEKRWRTSLTFRERTRLWETRFYERFGVPRWRHTRHLLLGTYKPKAHPTQAYRT